MAYKTLFGGSIQHPSFCRASNGSILLHAQVRRVWFRNSSYAKLTKSFAHPPWPFNSFGAGKEKDEGVENGEETDGPNMVPLDAESDGGLGDTSEIVYGPLAVLLVGFIAEEVDRFRDMMNEMEADMVKVIPCTPELLDLPLGQALESDVPPYQSPILGSRHFVFLSGMYSSEVVEVITAYRDAGLPSAIWAAAVPNNMSTRLTDLMEEVHQDHIHMQRKAQGVAVQAMQQRLEEEGE